MFPFLIKDLMRDVMNGNRQSMSEMKKNWSECGETERVRLPFLIPHKLRVNESDLRGEAGREHLLLQFCFNGGNSACLTMDLAHKCGFNLRSSSSLPIEELPLVP
jgi:hypothetical protein